MAVVLVLLNPLLLPILLLVAVALVGGGLGPFLEQVKPGVVGDVSSGSLCAWASSTAVTLSSACMSSLGFVIPRKAWRLAGSHCVIIVCWWLFPKARSTT